jgi:hypothetical protein
LYPSKILGGVNMILQYGTRRLKKSITGEEKHRKAEPKQLGKWIHHHILVE